MSPRSMSRKIGRTRANSTRLCPGFDRLARRWHERSPSGVHVPASRRRPGGIGDRQRHRVRVIVVRKRVIRVLGVRQGPTVTEVPQPARDRTPDRRCRLVGERVLLARSRGREEFCHGLSADNRRRGRCRCGCRWCGRVGRWSRRWSWRGGDGDRHGPCRLQRATLIRDLKLDRVRPGRRVCVGRWNAAAGPELSIPIVVVVAGDRTQPKYGAEPVGSSVTSKPLTKTTKVAMLGGGRLPGLPPPPLATRSRIATVAVLSIGSPPPKKLLIRGVKNVNWLVMVTDSVFPGPPPPDAVSHQIPMTLAGVRQTVTRSAAWIVPCAPAWPWTFRSSFARLRIPWVSVGWVAP